MFPQEHKMHSSNVYLNVCSRYWCASHRSSCRCWTLRQSSWVGWWYGRDWGSWLTQKVRSLLFWGALDISVFCQFVDVLLISSMVCINCFCARNLPMPFAPHLFIKSSGSMEPAFYRGDLLFLTNPPSSSYKTGDITVYQIPGVDIPIVHRVIETHDVRGLVVSLHLYQLLPWRCIVIVRHLIAPSYPTTVSFFWRRGTTTIWMISSYIRVLTGSSENISLARCKGASTARYMVLIKILAHALTMTGSYLILATSQSPWCALPFFPLRGAYPLNGLILCVPEWFSAVKIRTTGRFRPARADPEGIDTI